MIPSVSVLEQVKSIKTTLGVKEKTHIVLYAPTFKGSEGNATTFSEGAEIIDVNLVKNHLNMVIVLKYSVVIMFIMKDVVLKFVLLVQQIKINFKNFFFLL